MTLENTNRASGAAVGFILATSCFVALAVIVKFSMNVPAIDADRAAARAKALAEIRTAEEKSLDTRSAGLTSRAALCACRLEPRCSWPRRRGRIPRKPAPT